MNFFYIMRQTLCKREKTIYNAPFTINPPLRKLSLVKLTIGL